MQSCKILPFGCALNNELLSGELWVSLHLFDMLVFRSFLVPQIFILTFIGLFLN